MKRLVFPLFCLITGLLAGYFLGQKSTSHSISSASPALKHFEKNSATSVTSNGSAQADTDAKETKGVSNQSFLDSVNELVETYNAKAADQFARSLTIEQIQQALQRISGNDKGPANNLRADLFRAWAAKDPKTAWAAAVILKSNQGRIGILAAIAAEYAKTDPQAAIALSLTLGMGSDRTFVLNSLVTGWARKDFHAATAYLSQHPDLPLDRYSIYNAINETAKENPQLALDQALSLPSADARAGALSYALGALYHQDSQAAINRATSLTDPIVRDEAIKALLSAMASEDPRKALAFLESPQFSGSRKDVLGDLLYNWLLQDPAAAFDYIAANPDLPLRNNLSMRMGQILAKLTPDEQRQLLSSLPDGDFKTEVTTQFTHEILGAGKYTQAVATLNELPDSEDRDNTLSIVGRTWGEDNPRVAANWLNQQPDSTDRDIVISGYATVLAKTDVEGAMRWANSILDKGIQRPTLKSIAVQWLQTDFQAANAWLQKLEISVSEKNNMRLMAKEGRDIIYTFNVTNRR